MSTKSGTNDAMQTKMINATSRLVPMHLQIKALKSWLHHADDLQQVWEDLRSETAKEVAPKVSPAALDLLAQSIRWPDISIPAMMAV